MGVRSFNRWIIAVLIIVLRLSFARGDEPLCNGTGATIPLDSTEVAGEVTQITAPLLSCPKLFETCSPSHKVKLWAQQRVDADLMRMELDRIGLPQGHTKVAVIDTGFDIVGNSQNLEQPLARISGETPGQDSLGHGTAVIGVIGGKNGVGGRTRQKPRA